MIASVVVQVEHSQQFTIVAHGQLFGNLDSFAQGLAGVLLHLNVVELAVGKSKKDIEIRARYNLG